MPTYSYVALDTTGRVDRGQIQAESRLSALEQLAGRGLSVTTLTEKTATEAVSRPESVKPTVRLPASQVEAFMRELANLLAAGVPLSRALHILRQQAAHPAARAVWSAVHDDVVGGLPLAEAMARWPRVFSSVYVAMVQAGEAGGFLDLVLNQIADFRAREAELKGKVKAALVYPCVLAVVAVGVMAFLLVYFIPRFTGIFAEFGASLPALTRAVVGISLAVKRYILVIAVLTAGLVWAIRRYQASEKGRRTLERMILKLPGLGLVVARLAMVRFCRMLGTLLQSGVPLVTALRVSRQALGNQTLADAVNEGIEQVKRGSSLARGLSQAPQLFPPTVLETIAVAEEASRLDQELLRLAKTYEDDLDRRLRMLVSLVEPAMLFLMAGLIGTVIVAMLLPVFTLQELVR